MKKKIFNTNELEQIIELRKNNMTLKEIAQQFHVSRPVIARVLNENRPDLANTRVQKIQADYDKFHVIDSAEKAYWLGFIAADGCVYQRDKNATLIISIHQKDIEHLKKFQKFMNTTAEIKTFVQTTGFSSNTKPSPMCKISLNSKSMIQDIIDKNVTPNKSLTLRSPNIQSQYYLPFILGYFDGDGSVFKTKQNLYGISIVGTQNMLN